MQQRQHAAITAGAVPVPSASGLTRSTQSPAASAGPPAGVSPALEPSVAQPHRTPASHPASTGRPKKVCQRSPQMLFHPRETERKRERERWTGRVTGPRRPTAACMPGVGAPHEGIATHQSYHLFASIRSARQTGIARGPRRALSGVPNLQLATLSPAKFSGRRRQRARGAPRLLQRDSLG